MRMQRILLPLLAALVLPNAVNAESIQASVAREQWPRMEKLMDNAGGLFAIGDIDGMCMKVKEYDLLLKMHLEGLQEVYPDGDFFALMKKVNALLTYC